MAGASDYLENKVVDHSLGTTAFTAPTAVYLALYSSDPGDDNSGTELTAEPGYARQEITFGSAASGTAASTSVHTFTSSSGDWSAATHFGILDALTNGNLLFSDELSAGVIIGTGGHEFGAGDFTVTGA